MRIDLNVPIFLLPTKNINANHPPFDSKAVQKTMQKVENPPLLKRLILCLSKTLYYETGEDIIMRTVFWGISSNVPLMLFT